MNEQTTIPELSPEDWERIPESGKALILSLLQRVATLEEQIKLNSQNSHKPPSSDFNTKHKKRPTGKKRGGQPGHKGHSRSFLPEHEVTTFIPCRPQQCHHCSAPLSQDIRIGRHQIIELPTFQPVVTEFQIYSCVCSLCGKTTKGQLPKGTPSGSYGPRLTAFSALLTGHFQLSKRLAQELLHDLFNIPISLGTLSHNERRTSSALEPVYEQLKTQLPEQKALYIDETRFDKKGQKGWLWTFASDDLIVYQHRDNRRRTLLETLVGHEFPGIVVSDRYRAYEYFPGDKRQICWAHLIRDFKRFRVRGGESEKIGDLLLSQAENMFDLWHQVRAGTSNRETFATQMEPVRQEVEKVLLLGVECGHDKTAGTCRELVKHFESLWTFVQVEGIEPTNNTAERAMRKPVIYRKRCFGVDSTKGARFVERLLSVVESAKQQGKDMLDFLEATVNAWLRKEPSPSLLPT